MSIDNCSASGEGLYTAVANEPASFIITACDCNGTCVAHGGDIFSVSLTGASGVIAGLVVDNLDGTYSVQYEVPLGGLHEISIKHAGEHICSSPFSVGVQPGTCLDDACLQPCGLWMLCHRRSPRSALLCVG